MNSQDMLWAVLLVAGCFARKAPGHAADVPADAAWPNRRHYLLLALFFMLIALLGSVVPLQFQAVRWSQAVEVFSAVLRAPTRMGDRSDFTANALLGMPIGFCLLAGLTLGRRTSFTLLLGAPLVLAVSAAWSAGLEFAQLWVPGRTSSKADIVAQAVGSALGVGLWLIAGRPISTWLRSYGASHRAADQVDWLLQAYVVGLLIYSVMPMDLTLNPDDLYDKFRSGQIVLVPFSDVRLGIGSVYGLARDTALYVPVGMLAATWLTSVRRPVRPLWLSAFLGGLVVLGIECVQLLVASRMSSATQAVTGVLGVAAGAWAMGRWRGECRAAGSEHGGRHIGFWLAMSGVYALLLVAVFCAPFEPVLRDLQEIEARMLGFFRPPLTVLYVTHQYTAVAQIFRKVAYFVPLGILLALAIAPLRVSRGARRVLRVGSLLLAAGLGTAIEMLQVFLPTHTPDATDVLIYLTGAVVGLLATVRILDARSSGSGES